MILLTTWLSSLRNQLNFPSVSLLHFFETLDICIPYCAAKACVISLANFLLCQAKMVTEKQKPAGAGSSYALQLFCFLVQAPVTFECAHFTLQQNVNQFISCWAIDGALCKVEDGKLVLHVSPHGGNEERGFSFWWHFFKLKCLMLGPWDGYTSVHFNCLFSLFV